LLGALVNTASASSSVVDPIPTNNVVLTTTLAVGTQLLPAYQGGSTNFSITFPTIAGVTYIIEYASSLSSPTWTLLTSFVGTGAVVTYTDHLPQPPPPMRYYRLRVQQ